MKAIVICGPTASGKTNFSIELAKNISGSIINADSMQIYKEIEIISAAPSEIEKNTVPHYLFGHLEAFPPISYSVADYVVEAAKQVRSLIAKNSTPIIVGGTGMYINSLIYGFSAIPNIDPEVRCGARKLLNSLGNKEFFQILTGLDPLISSILNPNDSQRILRAYEVITQTGKSITYYHSKPPLKPLPEIEFDIYVLNPERKFLYDLCNKRFFDLLDKGALEEVKALYAKDPSKSSAAFKALGVKELLSYLEWGIIPKPILNQTDEFKSEATERILIREYSRDLKNSSVSFEMGNGITYDQAINLAQTSTRQFAKRQQTWFRHQLPLKHEITYNNIDEFLKAKDVLIKGLHR